MLKIIESLNRQPKSLLILVGFLQVVILGVLNYLDGHEFSFLIFYLLPVFWVTWFVGRGAGILISAASLCAWIFVNAFGPVSSGMSIPYWSLLARAAFFLMIPYFLSELKSALEHERELARIDPLTGAANRRHFGESASLELARALRYEHPLTVAYLDIDNFKLINDRWGHPTGDSVLRLTVETIRKNIRAVDVLARLGGDEFVLLMPETGPESGRLALAKMHKNVSEFARQKGWSLTFSIGAVTFVRPPVSADELIRASDDRMYSAKRKGKNQIVHEVVIQPEVAPRWERQTAD